MVATDLAGNSSHDDSDDNFTVDSTPPNGTVAIAEGDYTNSRDVHLALDAPGDTTEMYLDGDLIDASNVRQWTAYTTATTVTLTAGEGSKTTTVRYRDSAGHEGDLASDTVIYDATAPMIEDESPGDGSTIITGTPVISATLTGGMSGIDSTTIAMTVDGSLVVHAYDPGSGTVSYTPSPALTNASHVVAISVQDRAGNPVSETWDFSVNEPPASVLLTANPTSILPDGISTATVTATVRSISGHFVADGTQVVFTTTMGTLAGGTFYATTTHEGVATAVLTAPTTEGKAIITAKAGDAEGMTEVLLTFQPYHVYLPLVINVYLP